MKTIELYENGMTLKELAFGENDEHFFEEEIIVAKLLQTESDEIVFTTSDEDFGACRLIFDSFEDEGQSKGYTLKSKDGINIVYNCEEGFETIFIRKQDVSLIQELL